MGHMIDGVAKGNLSYPGETPRDGVHVTSILTTVHVIEHFRGGKRISSALALDAASRDRQRAFFEEMDSLMDADEAPPPG
jgi:hypothetical protein